jgi:hypothetical protein
MKKRASKATSKRSGIKKQVEDYLKAGRQRIEEIPFEPIWNRTKKEVKVAAGAIGRGTEVAAKRTIKLGKRAGLMYQIYMNNLKLQSSLAELGGRIYDLARTHSSDLILNDLRAIGSIKKVEEMDQKIIDLKQKVKALRKY